ncbi:MAG: M10 family metallopeptidase C-terminal domain-containing protein [Candidatus Arsenophonus phytopathogenicus]
MWGRGPTFRQTDGTNNSSSNLFSYQSYYTNDVENSEQQTDFKYVDHSSPLRTGLVERNIFVYLSFEDSKSSAPDRIMDFQTGEDKIDLFCLNKILYDNYSGQHILNIVNDFDRKPGEMKIIYDPVSHWSRLLINTNNDDISDFAIDIYGYINKFTDFILNQ